MINRITKPEAGSSLRDSFPSLRTARRAGEGQIRLLLIVIIGIGLILGLYLAAPRLRSLIGGEKAAPGPIPATPVPDLTTSRTKAEQGDAAAQRDLGLLYAKGLGVKQDYQEAAKWYRLAAVQGNPAAQFALAELCEAGQGTKQDDAEAASWYQKAADQGYAPAQYALAAMYVVGRGVAPNEVEALKWYRKAAEQGDELAQYNLGMRYLEGKGVKADLIEAFFWLTLSKSGGLPEAGVALDSLKPKLTREQLVSAQRKVAEFTAQHPSKSGK